MPCVTPGRTSNPHAPTMWTPGMSGSPLLAPLTIMGWPVVDLWVASSDTDADLFAYLEDYDPKADKARCAVCETEWGKDYGQGET